MEAGGPELLDYMKAENAVTEEALKPFATQNAAILDELTKLEDAVPLVRGINRTLDQYFYLETPPGKSDAQLKTRPVAGGEGRLLLDPATMATAGQHAAIDYFVPSPDCNYVAVGVSLGGSENSTLHVLEVTSGKLMGESISLAQDAEPSWTDDSKGFYFARLQEMAPGAAASTKYDNRRVYFHLLGTGEASDVPVFGSDISRNLGLPKNGEVTVQVIRGTKMLLASQVSGVVETPAYWVRRAENGPWTKVVEHEDTVLELEVRGTRAYGMTKGGSHGPIGNGRVLSFDLAKESFANAHVVVPESSLILSAQRGTGLRPALDALYVYGFHDALGVVVRVPYENEPQQAELPLPVSGSVVAVVAEIRRPGVTVVMQGWTTPLLAYAYSPQTHSFIDTGLQPRSPVDMSAITSKEVLAPSADGTMVPLSILYRKDLAMDGSNPTAARRCVRAGACSRRRGAWRSLACGGHEDHQAAHHR
jgi:prolyl oligopeptidase